MGKGPDIKTTWQAMQEARGQADWTDDGGAKPIVVEWLLSSFKTYYGVVFPISWWDAGVHKLYESQFPDSENAREFADICIGFPMAYVRTLAGASPEQIFM